MPMFNLRIFQGYRVERSITIEVEADDLESAIEEQSSGEAPDFDDPRWETGWELMNEEVMDAKELS